MATFGGLIGRNGFGGALVQDATGWRWADSGEPEVHAVTITRGELIGEFAEHALVDGRPVVRIPAAVAAAVPDLAEVCQRIGRLGLVQPHAGRVYRGLPGRRVWTINPERWAAAMREPVGVWIPPAHARRVLERIEAKQALDLEAARIEAALDRTRRHFFARSDPRWQHYSTRAAASWAIVETTLTAMYGAESRAFLAAEEAAFRAIPADFLLLSADELAEWAREVTTSPIAN